jgi:hypothetical protein
LEVIVSLLKVKSLGALLVLSVLFNSAAGESLTVKEMIARADEQMRGEQAQGVYEMTIVTPHWKRTLRMRFWEDVENDRAFVRVLFPAKEAGSASLKIGNEMWTYLPSVERSLKIPPSMMTQSWMGSDFTNEDLVNADDYVEEYTHACVDTVVVDSQRVYVIESIPKPEAPVVWGKVRYYARTGDFLPVRQEFYDEDGHLVRRMIFSDFREMDGRMIPALYTVEPLTEEKAGHRTLMRIEDMKFDVDLSRRIFTRANLERTR